MNTPPKHIIATINRLVRTSGQMLRATGQAPTTAELAQEMDMLPEQVVKLLDVARKPIRLDR